MQQENNQQSNAASSSRKTDRNTLNFQSSIMLYLHDFVWLFAVILLVFLFAFRVVVVSGPSMNNTLLDGDYLLLVDNLLCGQPQQGDIVVASKETFRSGEPIVKRVIATEGQEVYIDFAQGIVYVDGIALDEPYTLTPTTLQGDIELPLKVEPGCLFVMGDNRNNSSDSRIVEIGLVDCREILGKAVFLILPGTDGGEESRDFSRIGVLS